MVNFARLCTYLPILKALFIFKKLKYGLQPEQLLYDPHPIHSMHQFCIKLGYNNWFYNNQLLYKLVVEHFPIVYDKMQLLLIDQIISRVHLSQKLNLMGSKLLTFGYLKYSVSYFNLQFHLLSLLLFSQFQFYLTFFYEWNQISKLIAHLMVKYLLYRLNYWYWLIFRLFLLVQSVLYLNLHQQ